MKSVLQSLAGSSWRILVIGFAFAFGLIAGRLIFYSLGGELPRMPQQAEESVAVYYLLTGSLVLAAGLFPLIQEIKTAFLNRFLIIFAFLFACFGISDSLESAIYSSIDGYHLMAVVLVLPILLFSLTSASLTKSQADSKTFLQKGSEFFRNRTSGEWAWRILLTVLAFPLVYFVFGLAVSPLVTDYYAEGGYGLAIPSVGVIILVQLFRSVLFLLITIPILVTWQGSHVKLILYVALAHFVMVFSYDIVLAYQLPLALVLTHGVEIFLDSLVYSLILVKLLCATKEHSTQVEVNASLVSG